jgi:hypothetical protein
MMLFKSWGYMLMANGLTFVQDMKVGHYVSIIVSPAAPSQIMVKQLTNCAVDESTTPIHVSCPVLRCCLAVACTDCYIQLPNW